MTEEILTECPHCQAVWGFEEIDWQQCDCCGYPDCDEYDEINEYE